MSQDVIIIGASGHAKVIIDILERTDGVKITGLIDQNSLKGTDFLGYKILGNDADLPEIMKKYPNSKYIIAIGDNWTRGQVYNFLLTINPKVEFISAIHPSALIGKSCVIENGTVIMPGVIINCFSHIGKQTIINTNSSVDHDCFLSDFSSLAPNVTLGGNVNIGKFTAISIGATIIHGKTLGENCVVGAGSLVLKNFGNNVVLYGFPAQEIRTRKNDEKYLV